MLLFDRCDIIKVDGIPNQIKFLRGGNMPLIIVRNDITRMNVDAIVNAANETLLGGGGVDGAIHRAAGEGLLRECRTLCGCETGKAKITGGYDLPAKYVIHTVGPIYKGGDYGEEILLESCYRESLELALEHGCRSVAFPLISSGAYKYPKKEAFEVASRIIREFLSTNEMTVYLVLFDRASYTIGEALFSDIKEYISDRYSDESIENRRIIDREIICAAPEPPRRRRDEQYALDRKPSAAAPEPPRRRRDEQYALGRKPSAASSDSLAGMLMELDESFSEMLLRKIDEKGMTDAECYKKANIDRKLFSKIRGDVHYRPSKPTVIAFAISLELSLAETEEMLRKAGFALSHSNKFDIIIEYFIRKGIYDVFKINEALFAFDQSLLGM